MAQPLFEADQHCLLVAAFGEDDAIGMQPSAGQRRCEQVTRAQAQQHGAIDAREHAGDEQRGCRGMDSAKPTTGELM